MKYAVPAGLAFVIFLPVLAVLKFAYNEDAVGNEFMSARMPFTIQEGRVADFRTAMEDAMKLDRKREEELDEVIETLPGLNVTTLITTMKTGVTTNTTCTTCFKLFRSARVAVKSFTKREMTKMAGLACMTFFADFIDTEVCKGALHQYLDSIYQIAELVFAAGMSQNDICGLIFGPKCGPLTAPAHTWTVKLPRKRTLSKLRTKPLPGAASGAMKVLHLSDFHYDPLYRVGGLAQCGDPLCCRDAAPEQPDAGGDDNGDYNGGDRAEDSRAASAGPHVDVGQDIGVAAEDDERISSSSSSASSVSTEVVKGLLNENEEDDEGETGAATPSGDNDVRNKANLLQMSEAPRSKASISAVSPLAGRFGDLRSCDMPLETIESLVSDAANSNGKVSHVYLTGDIPPHDIWKSDKEEYYNITKTVYDLLADRIAPEIPVFPAVGNHEAVPPNLFTSDSQNAGGELAKNTVELYNNLAEFWQPWLGEQQLETVRQGGYYAKSVSPRLKVISLNTNMCYYFNFWLLVDSRDPGGQLAWLVDELLDSEIRNQRVHILGHVPPSSFDCIYSWSTQFLRIVQRFNSTITGQFYGHTHFDQFNVFYAEDRVTPIGTAFMAPSATSYSHVNPAYKLFTLRDDGVPHNAITRWFDLARANARGAIEWEIEYDTAATFGLSDLTPASMDRLSKQLAEDTQAFDAYYRFYHRNSPSARWAQCGAECRKSHIEATRSGVHHDGPTWYNVTSR